MIPYSCLAYIFDSFITAVVTYFLAILPTKLLKVYLRALSQYYISLSPLLYNLAKPDFDVEPPKTVYASNL